MSKVEVIPLFRVNIENGCPAFPTLPSNYHLTWPNIAPHYCLPGKCISECFIECFDWVEIVRSVPSALIILTWKCDSHPTSQGSLTPGKLDLVFLIHDLHRSTKDLSSPVSKSAETTDGNWNFTWLRLRLFSPHKATGVTTFGAWWKKWPVWFLWTGFLQHYFDFKHRNTKCFFMMMLIDYIKTCALKDGYTADFRLFETSVRCL